MTKGTQSFGTKRNKTHSLCIRCGYTAFHNAKKICGKCGYPGAKMRRYDGWSQKAARKVGQGTGRMRYLKTVPRRAKNGFRVNCVAKPKARKTITK
mmetsp:Transcript_139666/g.197789  ORF Transcript_139666/g.197789 Transcript_139666/m.197789 type:complete len:96 (+) Transcript_139666:81-368(+)